MPNKFLLVLFFACCQLPLKASFIFNENASEAYKAIFDLRLNDARRYIAEEKRNNPQNGIAVLLDNYVDYFDLLTSENKADYVKFKGRRSERIDALDNNDVNSPYYLFAQAEVYLQWGLIKAKFGDYTSSTMDLRKAQSLLKKNNEKFSTFLPNQKSLGLIEVVFGAIPSNLKGIADLLGVRGNISKGVKQLEAFKSNIKGTKYSFYNDEVIFLLCFMDIDILHNRDNYAKLSSFLEDMSDKSLLKAYLQGYVAFKTGKNDKAISYLENIPKSNQYTPMPTVQYLLGNAKLCRMDKDAPTFLTNYLKEYNGTNYIKDTYLKLAYHYLLKGDMLGYSNYIKLVRTKGYAADEKDKQALKEANEVKPDVDLLKARLYFDGGYYTRALEQIKSKQQDELKSLRDQVELYYRLGRIYDRLDTFNQAAVNYQKAINIGKNETSYFAANSALLLGLLYEQQNNNAKAKYYYNMTLSMKGHEYQNSIDTQAKEGLARIK
ncbi:MAG: tetratricopeptide repeat protein [Candidatus Pedobacter colombiensis]|uniref:Tetratricopeptide repeat protein n=1 Tax=Candidatus Pedobacter colombiensis TaxID=3121371 RepID=A0AAJ6B749_9SPHI|nr:tetratricopeptide repeat protein [Pedobacter sp.]WEK20732.1 MAG: tetratricopeptide repeat protein [Pedobacter sp.]